MTREGAARRFAGALGAALLAIALLAYLAPFLLAVLNSFKSVKEILADPLALPRAIGFGNYGTAIERMRFPLAFANTLEVSALSVAGIVLSSSMAAHFLVRNPWRINRALFYLMVGSIYIPFQAVMIPLLKIYSSIHFLNSKLALVYMYLGFGSNMAVFLYSGFIKGIPLEIEEAAAIDGATRYQRFFRIVMPMLGPVTFTIVILDFLWIWNDYLLPSLVLVSSGNRTLQLSTFYFYGTYSVDYDLVLAALVLTVLPVIAVFVFLQRYIVEGIMRGALK